jgi:magnesium-transporting ATPase (P-type)
LNRLGPGDYLMLLVSILLFLALTLNIWIRNESVNSLEHSGWYFIIMLVLILLTLVLVVYPVLETELSLPPLPFATPPVLLATGFLILLTTTYELGRYNGVGAVTVSAGIGLWLAFICSIVYLLGALIKWAGRERRAT